MQRPESALSTRRRHPQLGSSSLQHDIQDAHPAQRGWSPSSHQSLRSPISGSSLRDDTPTYVRSPVSPPTPPSGSMSGSLTDDSSAAEGAFSFPPPPRPVEGAVDDRQRGGRTPRPHQPTAALKAGNSWPMPPTVTYRPQGGLEAYRFGEPAASPPPPHHASGGGELYMKSDYQAPTDEQDVNMDAWS